MFELDTPLHCIHVFTSPHMRRTTGGGFALGRKTRFAYERRRVGVLPYAAGADTSEKDPEYL